MHQVHCALGAQCYIGDAQWLCTIVQLVQKPPLVVHRGFALACTRGTMPYWWCRMVVDHCAPGAGCHMWSAMVVHQFALSAQCPTGGAQWSCTIVHRVHCATLVVHNLCALLYTSCTITYWWCRMLMHHCAPRAQCHIGSAQWPCTIMHRAHHAILVRHIGRQVHNATLGVHNGCAPLCTAFCTQCTMVQDQCAPAISHCPPIAPLCTTIVHHQ